MSKIFYTERDIEDLARSGTTTVTIGEDVVLTDLAREKAEKLGVKLVREDDRPPSAPQRPYIATPVKPPAPAPKQPSNTELQERVRQAVIARLGDEVDQQLLSTIISRVLASIETS